MNTKVDDFLAKTENWNKELRKLRSIVLECGLNEELKWGVPCYTDKNKNIVIIHGFKNYCALLFFNGALLQDAENLLIQQTKNVQAGRQIRFTNIKEINQLHDILKAYIFEAIEVENAGLKVEFKKVNDYKIPEEFQQKLNENTLLKDAFENLTPGRQRGYIIYFSEAKQSKTRFDRIEKYALRIIKGKGLTDCVCGLSKKMPACDGSHKQAK